MEGEYSTLGVFVHSIWDDATVLKFEATRTTSGQFINHRHELCHPSNFYTDAISCRASIQEKRPPRTPDPGHSQTVLESRSMLSDDFWSDRSPDIPVSRYWFALLDTRRRHSSPVVSCKRVNNYYLAFSYQRYATTQYHYSIITILYHHIRTISYFIFRFKLYLWYE